MQSTQRRPVIDQPILRLLERRGAWMTAVEIYAAAPDYPEGDYVLADLKALLTNGLLIGRTRANASAEEYGLPDWDRRPAATLTLRKLLQSIQRLVRQALAAT